MRCVSGGCSVHLPAGRPAALPALAGQAPRSRGTGGGTQEEAQEEGRSTPGQACGGYHTGRRDTEVDEGGGFRVQRWHAMPTCVIPRHSITIAQCVCGSTGSTPGFLFTITCVVGSVRMLHGRGCSMAGWQDGRMAGWQDGRMARVSPGVTHECPPPGPKGMPCVHLHAVPCVPCPPRMHACTRCILASFHAICSSSRPYCLNRPACYQHAAGASPSHRSALLQVPCLGHRAVLKGYFRAMLSLPRVDAR